MSGRRLPYNNASRGGKNNNTKAPPPPPPPPPKASHHNRDRPPQQQQPPPPQYRQQNRNPQQQQQQQQQRRPYDDHLNQNDDVNEQLQQQQYQRDPPPPAPKHWIHDCLSLVSTAGANSGGMHSGGAIAHILHNCYNVYRNALQDRALLQEIERLPAEGCPPEILAISRMPPTPVVQAVYSLCRAFLRGHVLAASSPKQRVVHLFNGYVDFAEFHQQERGAPAEMSESEALVLGIPLNQASNNKKPKHNVGWDTPILVAVVQHIRRSIVASGTSLDDDVVGDVARAWRSMFLFLVKSDPDYPNNAARRRGALVVFNALLSIHFSRGNFSQVMTLMNMIEMQESSAGGDPTKGVLAPCGHIKSEVTKFLYFQGRHRLVQPQQMPGADAPAVKACKMFADCCSRMPPVHSLREGDEVRDNKLRSLFYVCISALLSGAVPDRAVLEEDRFISDIVSPLATAVNVGSPKLLQKLLSDAQSPSTSRPQLRFAIGVVLRTRGVFILVHQQLHLLCVLTVVKRVHALVKEQGFDPSRLHLSLIERAAELFDKAAMEGDDALVSDSGGGGSSSSGSGSSSSRRQQPTTAAQQLKEVEERGADTSLVMAIAQLVQRGWIKGYLAYDADTMVLSKADPFPKQIV